MDLRDLLYVMDKFGEKIRTHKKNADDICDKIKERAGELQRELDEIAYKNKFIDLLNLSTQHLKIINSMDFDIDYTKKYLAEKVKTEIPDRIARILSRYEEMVNNERNACGITNGYLKQACAGLNKFAVQTLVAQAPAPKPSVAPLSTDIWKFDKSPPAQAQEVHPITKKMTKKLDS